MIEPVCLPALRVHGGRAWSVQRSDAMANGRFDEKGPLVGVEWDEREIQERASEMRSEMHRLSLSS